MASWVAVAVLLATLAGIGVGFVWWGLPLQRLRDDVDSLVLRATSAEGIRNELDRVRRA